MLEFLRGKPVVYSGFDGKLYVAKYRDGERSGHGIGYLEIQNAAGVIISDPLMAEHKARTFFWNLDAVDGR